MDLGEVGGEDIHHGLEAGLIISLACPAADFILLDQAAYSG
jgi:hypothetical protein